MAEGGGPSANSTGISIVLSGGGHRAALFGLGVLMYLADAGKNGEVGSIASVSGGSITNGFVGSAAASGIMTAFGSEGGCGSLTSVIVRKGTLFAPLRTKLYLVLLSLGLPAAFLPLWVGRWSWPVRILVVAFLVTLWARFLLDSRGTICALAFRDTLFSPRGPRWSRISSSKIPAQI